MGKQMVRISGDHPPIHIDWLDKHDIDMLTPELFDFCFQFCEDKPTSRIEVGNKKEYDRFGDNIPWKTLIP